MSNIQVNFNFTGYTLEELLQHSDVTTDVHKELEMEAREDGNFLGWLHLPSTYIKTEEYKKIKESAEKIRKDSDVLLVIGIGGSYLGARAVIEALHPTYFGPTGKKETQVIFVGNNLAPNYINDVINYVADKDFSINVISKSGTTTEPAIAFRIFKEIMYQKYDIKEARERIYVTTDAKKGALKKLAEEKYNDSLLQYNDCYQYAVLRNLYYDNGKNMEILATYEPRMHYFAEWWKQLFGESEGKENKGLFPVSVEFTTDLHSLGQYIQEGQRIMFETALNFAKTETDITIRPDEDNLDNLNYLAGKKLSYVNQKAMEGTVTAHADGGVPNIIINIRELNAKNIGELIYFFEKACATSAKLLEVDPFNQPGVEKYKTNMFKLLKKPGYEDK